MLGPGRSDCGEHRQPGARAMARRAMQQLSGRRLMAVFAWDLAWTAWRLVKMAVQ